eukprot:sb/3476687/
MGADIIYVQSERYNKAFGDRRKDCVYQEPTDTSEKTIRTRYLGHVTGYEPIRDQHFLIRSIPGVDREIATWNKLQTVSGLVGNCFYNTPEKERDIARESATRKQHAVLGMHMPL